MTALLAAGTRLGVGQAPALTSMANLIVAVAPQRDARIATGMNAVTRTIGIAFGSALSAVILAGTTEPGAAFASEQGYVVGFAVAAVATAGAVACTIALPRRATSPPVPLVTSRVDFSS